MCNCYKPPRVSKRLFINNNMSVFVYKIISSIFIDTWNSTQTPCDGNVIDRWLNRNRWNEIRWTNGKLNFCSNGKFDLKYRIERKYKKKRESFQETAPPPSTGRPKLICLYVMPSVFNYWNDVLVIYIVIFNWENMLNTDHPVNPVVGTRYSGKYRNICMLYTCFRDYNLCSTAYELELEVQESK